MRRFSRGPPRPPRRNVPGTRRPIPPTHRRGIPSVTNRRLRVFSGDATSSGGRTPPRGKGFPRRSGGAGNTNRGSGGKPPHHSSFGASGAAPEPNPHHRFSEKTLAALRRKELIKRRWKRAGIGFAIASAIGLGWLFMRPSPKTIEPVIPNVGTHDPVRQNGRRVPVDPDIVSERRPVDMLPGETMREYEKRIARERAAAEAAKRNPITPNPLEKEKFYSEKMSKQFVNQNLDFLRRAGMDAPEINWERRVWTPESSKSLAEVIGPNHIIEVTRQVNVDGKMVEQKMYAIVEITPGIEGFTYSIPGPMSGSPEMKSGQFEKGQQFGENLTGLLEYLGNPTITGVYGPQR